MSDDLFETVKPENVPALVYQGVTIHERDEMLNLTDMWKADGSRVSRKPALWRQLPATKALIEALQGNVGKSYIDIFTTQRGGLNAGTWAHWQLAIAYAQYLSPDFHLWCNKVVRFHMEGREMPSDKAAAPVLDAETRIAALEAQVSQLLSTDFRKEVAVPIMSYLHTLQKNYLDARFYKIAERQFEERAILETLVDDTTKLRQAMKAMIESSGERTAISAPQALLTINEAMSRVKIRSDRPRGVGASMSLQLAAWCEHNRVTVQRRSVSDGVVRCFFDSLAVDRWWDEVGQKAFGKYVKKGVRA